AAAPAWCRPRTNATASREISTGSSPNDSKPRPPSGVRMTLIVGASRMSTPLLLASVPSAAASVWTRAGSQVAPRADGQGRLADGLRSSMVMPRTPAGPSDTTMARSPMAGSGQVRQLSAPVSRRTLSSRLSAASRSKSRTSWALWAGARPLVRPGASRGVFIWCCGSRGRGEMQQGVLQVGGVGDRVVVLVGLGRPARVVLGGVLVPGRSVQQRDDRRLGGHDRLQRVQRLLLGGGVVAARELRQGRLSLRAVEPAVVAAGRLAGWRGQRAVQPVVEVVVRVGALRAPVDHGLEVPDREVGGPLGGLDSVEGGL